MLLEKLLFYDSLKLYLFCSKSQQADRDDQWALHSTDWSKAWTRIHGGQGENPQSK